MFIVVVGAGRIGTRVVELALKDGHDVAVFDKVPERCTAIARRLDVIAYAADATRESVLREAGVDEADGVIAATRSDPVNLMVVTLADHLGVPKRVSVLNKASSAPLFAEHGAHVVGNPSAVAAEHLLHAARHAGVGEYATVAGDVELFKADVEPESPLAGQALKDAGLPSGVLVAAVERGGHVILPRGDTVVQVGDVVTLLAKEDLVDAAMAKLHPGGATRGA
jgi:trk system potassium uptake protein